MTPSRSCWNSSPSTPSWEPGGVFDLEVLDQRSGFLLFRVEGKEADRAFKNESGGHRWQRVPPNERRGRVQTSTITVAVLREPPETEISLNPADLEWRTTRGSGPGGQNRNKVESCVVLTHKPTGLVVRAETERSQLQNKERALAILRARVVEQRESAVSHAHNEARRSQLGSGMRGDKRRTIRFQDGIVTDHVLGARWQLKDYLRGNF